jgi:hypothetical protein
VSGDLSGLGVLVSTVDFSFQACDSSKYWLPRAPVPFKGARGWPWQHQVWFTPQGRRYRIVDLVFQGAALALFILGTLPIW